jgi:hypothetical protein
MVSLYLLFIGESQVTEEAMYKVAKEMADKKITREDAGAVLVDFTELVPGKEGKRLGKTVIRYVLNALQLTILLMHNIRSLTFLCAERRTELPSTLLEISESCSVA